MLPVNVSSSRQRKIVQRLLSRSCLCLLILFIVFLVHRIRLSWISMKDRCTYVNNDLVDGAFSHQCAEIPKLRTNYQSTLHFVNEDLKSIDIETSPEEFDYSRCSLLSTFRAFVPKADHPLAKALAQHPASTSVRSDACVEIQFSVGQNLTYAGPLDGSNLLVVNLDSLSTATATGSVMIAQDRYAPGSFRAGLDFALHTDVAAFDIDQWKSEPFLLPVQRQIDVGYISDLSESRKNVKNSRAVRSILCTEKNCDFDLALVNFCIISHSPLFQAHLLLSLRSVCIPVILSRLEPLPFQDQLDWKLVAFRFPNSSIDKVLKHLAKLPREEFLEMRRRGIVFRRRLDNADALARTLLAAVAEIMQLQLPAASLAPTKPLFDSYESNNSRPINADNKRYERIASPLNHNRMTSNHLYSYARWNSGRDLTFTPRTLHDAYGLPAEAEYYEDSKIIRAAGSRNEQAFARGLGLNRDPEQFTVVMMTYNRDDGVREILERLNNCPHLNKVLIVWNNIGRVPLDPWPKIHVPIEFIRSERNSVNNRFLPFDRIETEAVFLLDDDMDLVHDELVYAFKVWRQNRDRIVGFFDRYHSWAGNTSGYGRHQSCEYSMVIGAFLVAHKEFFYEYSYNMHPAIRRLVDETMNCDDIAFNYVVSHLTRKPPMKVQKIVGNWNSKTIRGISAKTDHFTERDECMRKLNAIYGYNPLMLSQVKAMPSLDECVPGM